MKLKTIGVVLALNALAAVSLWHMSFSYFAEQDDEGFLMSSVLAWLYGIRSYDHYYTRYGLFYYFERVFLHEFLELPLSSAGIRWIAILSGLITCNLLSASVLKITKDIGSVCLLFLMFFIWVSSYTISEPGHPQELLMVVLASFVFCTVREERWTSVKVLVLGILSGLMLFIKINAGVFLGLVCVLALATGSKSGWVDKILRFVFWGAAFSIAPLVALPSLIHLEDFSLVTAIVLALIPVCHLSVSKKVQVLSPTTLSLYILSVCLIFVFFAGWYLTYAGDASSFANGFFFQHLSLPGQYSVPLPFGLEAILLSLASLVTYFVFSTNNFNRLAYLKCFHFVALFIFTLLEKPFGVISFGLAWSWVPLISQGEKEITLNRFLLTLLTIVFALYCYPVAGGQSAIVSILFLVLAAYSMSDLEFLGTFRASVVSQASAFLLLLVSCGIWTYRYQHAYPLRLPGSSHIRLSEYQSTIYQSISDVLVRNRQDFVSLPGMNSFYFWTQTTPPSWLNAAWANLFNTDFQNEVIEKLSILDNPVIVENRSINNFWSTELFVETPPIYHWMASSLPVLTSLSGFTLHSKKELPPIGIVRNNYLLTFTKSDVLSKAESIRLVLVSAALPGKTSFFSSDLGDRHILGSWKLKRSPILRDRDGNHVISVPSEISLDFDKPTRSFLMLECISVDGSVYSQQPIWGFSSFPKTN